MFTAVVEFGFWLVLTFTGVEGQDGLFYPNGIYRTFAPGPTTKVARQVELFFLDKDECKDAKKLIKDHASLFISGIKVGKCIPGMRLDPVVTPATIEDVMIDACGDFMAW